MSADSPAEQQGVRAGDAITAVNGEEEDMQTAMQAALASDGGGDGKAFAFDKKMESELLAAFIRYMDGLSRPMTLRFEPRFQKRKKQRWGGDRVSAKFKAQQKQKRKGQETNYDDCYFWDDVTTMSSREGGRRRQGSQKTKPRKTD